MDTFEIRDDFYLNGERFKIISGSMHYFRTVPEYWRDRLTKIRDMGCNTVETYIPWNLHEPHRGEFCFTGLCDVEGFVRTAQELGLWVILRPSPYICAEWEFGGQPAWLLNDPGMRLRSSEGPYLGYVRDYYRELFKHIAPLQVTEGGPVIMMQIENEYGAYGHDKAYLAAIRDMMKEFGCSVPMITSDGPWDDFMSCGSLDGTLVTANFGSDTPKQFGILRRRLGEGHPLMCTEFWVGWFDAWGDKEHNTGDLEGHVQDLDEMLTQGSVNIYMAHGGTNFGFMNGSNYYNRITPDVTSYDYDALLTEDGRPTEKYRRFKYVIDAHRAALEDKQTAGKGAANGVTEQQEIQRRAYGRLESTGRTGLFESLDEIASPTEMLHTRPMEALGQNYGYILYRAELEYEHDIRKFRLCGAADRAKVYLDGSEVLTLYDTELGREATSELLKTRDAAGGQGSFACPEDKAIASQLKAHPMPWNGRRLDILMENMGRVNYGEMMQHQHKGIKDGVTLNGHLHTGWKAYTLPLDNTGRLTFTAGCTEQEPTFTRFELELPDGADGDTFVDLTGFGKGCVIVNGFNLGRFWEIGPQKRLYLPAPLLKKGHNELIVFETEGKTSGYITLTDEPDLG